MKTKLFLKLLLVTCIAVLSSKMAFGQPKANSIEGFWLGKLKTQGIELRVIFNITKDGDNGYKSTLDSPDQGAKGIPLGKTSLDGKKLNIDAPALAASYVGEMVNDSTFNGTWTQAGKSFPLQIVKQKKALVINRPQEPKGPFQYNIEEVVVPNKQFGFNLGGTLTLPKGDGPFPAVVLITGSGQQNRDEEIFGHKPFWVIADYLTKRGFAVLRCDDRGVGKSKGSLENVTSYDFSTDALSSVEFLKTDKRIDSKKIGLIGHSEGGLIAWILAAQSKDIAFIVSLAGPGVKGEDVLYSQSKIIAKLSGASDEEIKEDNEINKIIYSILKSETDNAKVQQEIIEAAKAFYTKRNDKETDQKVDAISKSLSQKAYSWLRYFILSDPNKYLQKITCPVLALNGSKDVQVISEINLPAIEMSLKEAGNKDATIVEVKDVNHLFQHCSTGLPNEYGNIEETFSEDVLKTMGDWLSKRLL